MTKDRLVALDNGDLPTPDEAREYVALLRWRELMKKVPTCPQEK